MGHPRFGIDVWPLEPGRTLAVIVEPGEPEHPAELLPQVEAVWAEVRREHPRFYDGAILSVVALEPEQSRIVCRRESYKWLAARDAGVPTGAHQLGIVGIVIARDAAGVEHILLGRRSAGVRRHSNMWELAPCGGFDPPPPPSPPPPGAPPVVLGPHDALAALAAETAEELAIPIDWSLADLIAVYRDAAAHHDDIVACVRLAEPIDPQRPPDVSRHWEYTALRWLPIAEASAFDAAEADAIRPSTRALLRHCGWCP